MALNGKVNIGGKILKLYWCHVDAIHIGFKILVIIGVMLSLIWVMLADIGDIMKKQYWRDNIEVCWCHINVIHRLILAFKYWQLLE